MSGETWRQFRPQSDGHWLTVSVDRNGVMAPIERKPLGILGGRPAGIFWVNVAVHHASFEVEVPTAENALSFLVRTHLSWRVTDPIAAIRDNVRAAEFVYRPIIEQQLRAMCCQFEVDRFLDAEVHINSFYAVGTIELGHGLTLLGCRVQLRPDAETLGHLRSRTLDERAAERRRAEHEQLLREMELKHTENDAGQSLKLQSAQFEHDVAQVKGQNYIVREQHRMAHYLRVLREGDLSMFALQLASRRDDVGQVLQQLIVQHNLDKQTAHEIIIALLDKGMLNKRDGDQLLARVNALIENATTTKTAAGASPLPDIELTGSAIVADLVKLDEDADDLEDDEEDDGHD
jgi:transcriptional regulator CtsR